MLKYSIILLMLFFFTSTVENKQNLCLYNSTDDDIYCIMPNNSQSLIFISIQSHNICYTCFPSYINVLSTLIENKIPSQNIIYLYPDLRPIMQKNYVIDNFHVSNDRVTTIFNSTIYNKFILKFCLQKSKPQLLIFSKEKKFLVSYEYSHYSSIELNSFFKK
jgi:hypothetical protein